MTYIILSIASSMVTMAVMSYFLFRPKGLIETLMEHRGNHYQGLKTRVDNYSQKLIELEGGVKMVAVSTDEVRASLSRRLTAIETRVGKTTKKEQKEQEMNDALKLINQSAIAQASNNGV